MKRLVARLLLAVCGLFCAAQAGAVVCGADASPADYPWLVSVHNGTTSCSGSLVGADLVLTADHCIKDPAVGVHVQLPGRPSAVRAGAVLRITHADVALLRLQKPLDDAKMLRIAEAETSLADGLLEVAGHSDVELPPKSDRNRSPINPGPHCRERHSGIPRRAVVRVQADAPCRFETHLLPPLHWMCVHAWPAAPELPGQAPGIRPFAAGACLGDSGGPLLHRDVEGNPALVGIISAVSGADNRSRSELWKSCARSPASIVRIATSIEALQRLGSWEPVGQAKR